MGFKLKKITKSVGDFFEKRVGVLKDIKDWYDGTDAMQHQAQLQDQYNMKYWNMQNAYNSPASQMARYQEAGLNPNLIYGQANTASPIGSNSVQAPESGAGMVGKVGSTLASIYGIKNMKAQNENLQAQNALIKSQQSFTQAQKDRYEYETQWLKERGLSSQSPWWDKTRSVAPALDSTIKGFTGSRLLGSLPYLSPYIAISKLIAERARNARNSYATQMSLKDLKQRAKRKLKEAGVTYIKYKPF